MTIPRKFAKNTGWGRADHKKRPHELFPSLLNTHHRTSTLHLHHKHLTPIELSLFDLFTTVILTDI